MNPFTALWGRLGGRTAALERRGYTSTLTAIAEAHVAGTASQGDVSVTTVAEAAAGLYGRCFAAARVSPDGNRTAALTAPVLECLGRELVRRGEALFLIRVDEGTVSLQQACAWEVHGGVDSWSYRVTLAGPDGSRTVEVGADSVLHVRVNCSPDRPWAGRSPLATASMSASLAGWLEGRARDECSAQVGRVIPVPDSDATGDVEAGLAAMGGKTMLVPSTSSGWSEGPSGAPRGEWEARRIGAEPPASLIELRGAVHRSLFAACGIPAELVEAGEGTGAREALRRFLHTGLGPAARVVEAEASVKLGVDVKLDFEALFATDLVGRARAFGSLVTGGWTPAAAAEATGFEVEDGDVFDPVKAEQARAECFATF